MYFKWIWTHHALRCQTEGSAYFKNCSSITIFTRAYFYTLQRIHRIRKYYVCGNSFSFNNSCLQQKNAEEHTEGGHRNTPNVALDRLEQKKTKPHITPIRRNRRGYNSLRITNEGQQKIGKTLSSLIRFEFRYKIRMARSTFVIKIT